jgi:hypothetical protein
MLGDMQDQPRLLDDLRTGSVPVVALWQGEPARIPDHRRRRPGRDRGRPRALIGLGHERISFVSAEPG